MGENAMAQKAEELIRGIIEDETLTDIDKLDFLNYIRALADVVLNTVLDYIEEEDPDGR
jgi:hypothetical protein